MTVHLIAMSMCCIVAMLIFFTCLPLDIGRLSTMFAVVVACIPTYVISLSYFN